jgi:hypothetical protein
MSFGIATTSLILKIGCDSCFVFRAVSLNISSSLKLAISSFDQKSCYVCPKFWFRLFPSNCGKKVSFQIRSKLNHHLDLTMEVARCSH